MQDHASLEAWAGDPYVAPYVWELEQNGLIVANGLTPDGRERFPVPDKLPTPSVFRMYSLRNRESMPTIEVELPDSSVTLIYDHYVTKVYPYTLAPVMRTESLLIGTRDKSGREDVALVCPGGRVEPHLSKAQAIALHHQLFAK